MFARQKDRNQPLFKLDRSNEVMTETGRGHTTDRNMHQEQQDCSINEEKLASDSLHAKLHQEADTIRKWMNQTEFDIKQKDSKLQECNKTIDSLRKSVLDLQLHNESLSMNLQEEVSNREEVLQGISSVKILCEVLKEHLSKAETKIADCEAEKIEIRNLEQEHQHQVELLCKKFQDIELKAGKEHERLTTLVFNKTKEFEGLQEEMKQKSIASKTQLNQMLEKLDEKDIEIRDLSKNLQKYEEKIHDLQKTVESLKKELGLSEDRCNKTNTKHDQLIKEHRDLQNQRDALQLELNDKQEKLDSLISEKSNLLEEITSLKEQHSQKVHNLQTDLDDCKEQINIKDKKLRFLETDLENVATKLQEVQCSKDIVIMEKADLAANVSDLEKQQAEFVRQIEQNEFSLNQMNLNFNEIQLQLDNKLKEAAAVLLQFKELQAQFECSQSEKIKLGERVGQLENEVSLRQADVNDLQNQLQERSNELQCYITKQKETERNYEIQRLEAEESLKKLQDTASALSTSKGEADTQSKTLSKLKKDIVSLDKKNKSLQEDLQKSSSIQGEMRGRINELQSELEIEKERNQNIQDEKQAHEEAIAGELLCKEKTASEMEVKNKTLKADVTSKHKQIRELEKEVKQMKSKASTMEKKLSGKTEELQTKTTDIESLQEQLDNINEEWTKAKEKMEQMQEVAASCMKEKDEMFKRCEEERSQMSTIMQNYKTDNDKLVSAKEKETESLKKQMKSRVDKLQSEVDRLRHSMSESGHQMENLQKVYGEKETLVSKLEQENSKKNEELKELQKQLENMFIKTTTTTDVQTSPYPTIKRQASTPRVIPKTPQPSSNIALMIPKTPNLPKTPVSLETPSCKTPQRSILKSITSSANKKRRVMFASKDKDEEEDLLSEDSDTFEVLATGDKITKGTPLILKSPRAQTMNGVRADTMHTEASAISTVPLSRTPRGPPVDLEKIKTKKSKKKDKENVHMEDESVQLVSDAPPKTKDKSSVRTAPQKSGGRFFNKSPKNRKADLHNKHTSWFENDDIFGFALED